MAKTKVEKDKITYPDGTILTVRDGSNLLDLYYGAVYDLMTTGKTNKTPISRFVEAGYNKLESNSLSTIEHIVKDTAKYYADNKVDTDFIEYRISKLLFGWQKDLIADKAKKITLLCGRRAGKSYAEAALAVVHCLSGYDTTNGYKKDRKVAIIGLTVAKCANVFWQPILHFADLTGLKYKPNGSDYSVTFSNNATIQLFGNSSKAEREKLRGSEYSLIIIDEAQSQNGLEYLMTDILEPIIQGRGSTIVLSGTGSLTGYGKWADVTTGDQASIWKHYSATMADNPTIPDYEKALDNVLIEHNWSRDNITFQREYLGKNVIDTSRMVFPTLHYYDTIPKDFIAKGCIVGVDYGFTDYNAFAPVVYDDNKAYVVEERKFNHASVTQIVNVANELNDIISSRYKVKPLFVADNSDQSISREIFNRGISIQNAYKVDLNMQIDQLRDWLANGSLLIKSNGFIDSEAKQTVWKWNEETKSVLYEIDDDYYHPDIIHALRYAVNYIRAKYKR